MSSTRPWQLGSALLLFCLFLPHPGSAQRLVSVGLTPTYQVSQDVNRGPLPNSEYRAYGVMLGMDRSGSWWKPHVWLQRYTVESFVQNPTPEEGDSVMHGWSVSLGPAIQFLQSERFRGEILPQVSLGNGGPRTLDTGIGVHFSLRAGFFQPQIFGRYQTHGSQQFWTLGVGATLEWSWTQERDLSDYWR